MAEGLSQTGDDTLEAMRARLVALQAPLGVIIAKSARILDRVFAYAPHPSEMPEGFPVWAVTSADAEPGQELHVRVPEGKTVRIDKNPLSATPAYPLRRAWLLRPDDGGTLRKIEVVELAGIRARRGFPYEIETSRFSADTSQHLGFIGDGYKGQEPSMAELSQALDDAEVVALRALGLVPAGRPRAGS